MNLNLNRDYTVAGGEVERMHERDQVLQAAYIRELAEDIRRGKIINAGMKRFIDSRRLREEFDGDPKQWMSLVEKIADGTYPDCWDIVPKP